MKKLSRKEMDNLTYNELTAYAGLPFSHLGGLKATEKLFTTLQLKKDETLKVLDIGCGSGYTACQIAKRYGCQVTGIDLSEIMIMKARERAEKEKLHNVEFRVGDANKLPFDNNYFDVVLAESVTIFLPDRKGALREYLRVTKPGGRIGNLEVFLKSETPLELIKILEAAAKEVINPQFTNWLTKSEWKALFEELPLEDLQVIELKDELSINIRKEIGLVTLIKSLITIFWHLIVNKQVRRTLLNFKEVDDILTAKKGKEYLYSGCLIAVGKKS